MIHRRLTRCEHGCSSIRCDIDQDLEEMVASARSMVDWKHYVKTYPWVCLGTAAALGFLIVPKRSTAIDADLATLTELARTGHLVVKRRGRRARIGRCRSWLPSPRSRFARQPPTWAKVPEDYWEHNRPPVGHQAHNLLIPGTPNRPDPSNAESATSCAGRSWAWRTCVGMARKEPSRSVRSIERFVAQRPGFCLGAALSVGIALGWWVKRQ